MAFEGGSGSKEAGLLDKPGRPDLSAVITSLWKDFEPWVKEQQVKTYAELKAVLKSGNVRPNREEDVRNQFREQYLALARGRWITTLHQNQLPAAQWNLTEEEKQSLKEYLRWNKAEMIRADIDFQRIAVPQEQSFDRTQPSSPWATNQSMKRHTRQPAHFSPPQPQAGAWTGWAAELRGEKPSHPHFGAGGRNQGVHPAAAAGGWGVVDESDGGDWGQEGAAAGWGQQNPAQGGWGMQAGGGGRAPSAGAWGIPEGAWAQGNPQPGGKGFGKPGGPAAPAAAAAWGVPKGDGGWAKQAAGAWGQGGGGGGGRPAAWGQDSEAGDWGTGGGGGGAGGWGEQTGDWGTGGAAGGTWGDQAAGDDGWGTKPAAVPGWGTSNQDGWGVKEGGGWGANEGGGGEGAVGGWGTTEGATWGGNAAWGMQAQAAQPGPSKQKSKAEKSPYQIPLNYVAPRAEDPDIDYERLKALGMTDFVLQVCETRIREFYAEGCEATIKFHRNLARMNKTEALYLQEQFDTGMKALAHKKKAQWKQAIDAELDRRASKGRETTTGGKAVASQPQSKKQRNKSPPPLPAKESQDLKKKGAVFRSKATKKTETTKHSKSASTPPTIQNAYPVGWESLINSAPIQERTTGKPAPPTGGGGGGGFMKKLFKQVAFIPDDSSTPTDSDSESDGSEDERRRNPIRGKHYSTISGKYPLSPPTDGAFSPIAFATGSRPIEVHGKGGMGGGRGGKKGYEKGAKVVW